MNTRDHPTFRDAYRHALRMVLDRGEPVAAVKDDLSVGSEFGRASRKTLELRPFAFRVAQPRACLIRSQVRQPDLGYIAGQWAWFMRGSNDAEAIGYYNPRGLAFSDDGETLYGAFGARARAQSGDQIEGVLSILRRDPGSRRAFVAFVDPRDAVVPTRDKPCAIGIHFFIRGGHLEAVTSMRSQSALMVLPYDVSLFMALHTWMAAALDLEIGPHTWIANSFHLYEDEIGLAREVLHSPMDSVSLEGVRDPVAKLEELLAVEERLRRAGEARDAVKLRALAEQIRGSGELHDSLSLVLVAHAARHLGDRQLFEMAVDNLPANWRECVRRPGEAVAAAGRQP